VGVPPAKEFGPEGLKVDADKPFLDKKGSEIAAAIIGEGCLMLE
jgi:hypothetical protein